MRNCVKARNNAVKAVPAITLGKEKETLCTTLKAIGGPIFT